MLFHDREMSVLASMQPCAWREVHEVLDAARDRSDESLQDIDGSARVSTDKS